MVSHIHHFKLQMQYQSVPICDISLSKVNPHNIFVLYDLATYLDHFQGIN